MADPEVDALYSALQPHMRDFIKAYMETLTIVEAAEVVGMIAAVSLLLEPTHAGVSRGVRRCRTRG